MKTQQSLLKFKRKIRHWEKHSSITEAFQLSETTLWMKTWLCGAPRHSSHTQTWPTWFRAGTRQGETDSRMHRDRWRSMQTCWKDSQGHEPRIKVSNKGTLSLSHVDSSCVIVITHTYSTHILYMNHRTQSDQTARAGRLLVFPILLCLAYLHRTHQFGSSTPSSTTNSLNGISFWYH